MARPLRIEYPGAVYHITVRGNNKNIIFHNEIDRKKFILLLKEIIEMHNWICYAYCLMGNHYHLLIETVDANLSDGMRDLNGRFAQTQNFVHGTTGHFFEDRFKSFLIEKETYLLEVLRYTVLNPVRAGIVSSPEKWQWSSFNSVMSQNSASSWIANNFILGLFSDNKTRARDKYAKFVFEGIGKKSPFKKIKEGIILGSDQFIHQIYRICEDNSDITEIIRSERMVGRPSLQDLFIHAKKDRIIRNEAIKLARHRCSYSITEIANHLGMSSSAISQISRELR